MLYLDFCFELADGALCLCGWGASDAVADLQLRTATGAVAPPAFVSYHPRRDLNGTGLGFLAKFPLPAGADPAEAHLHSDGIDVAISRTAEGFGDLIAKGLDEAFFDLLFAVGAGHIALTDPRRIAALHGRAAALASDSGLAESPTAMIAQEMAVCFSETNRVLVRGWMAQAPGHQPHLPVRRVACLLSRDRLQPIGVDWDAVLRPDLGTVRIAARRAPLTAGFAAAATADPALQEDGLSLICLRDGQQTLVQIRRVQRQDHRSLHHHLHHLEQSVAEPQVFAALRGRLLPPLPAIRLADPSPEPVDGSAPVTFVLDHDLDHGLIRDVLRRLRGALPPGSAVAVLCEGISEHLLISARADRMEAGDSALPLIWLDGGAQVRHLPGRHRHLLYGNSASLMQTDLFPLLAGLRDEGVAAAAVFFKPAMTATPQPVADGMVARLCHDGAPLLAQIDLTALHGEGEEMPLSLGAQIRWMLEHFARIGAGRFFALSDHGLADGIAPLPEAIRLLETAILRQASQEAGR